MQSHKQNSRGARFSEEKGHDFSLSFIINRIKNDSSKKTRTKELYYRNT